MPRPLVLHQMTVMDVPPLQLPELAAKVGCAEITLFTFSPGSGLPAENAEFQFPLVTPHQKVAVREALEAPGVGVSGIEFFPITPDIHSSSDYLSEAHERKVPGMGDFPLAELVAALPASTVTELEVPSDQRRASSRSAEAYARDVVIRARAIVDAAPMNLSEGDRIGCP